MKKKILRIGIFIILIVMLIILTGCNNSNQDDSKESTKTETISSKTEGKLSNIITEKNYGDKIDYSANGIDDWKIFYNDGENVFIIASEIIPNSKVSDNIGMESRKSQYLGNYNVIWDWNNEEFLKYNGGESIDNTIASKYMFYWKGNNNTDKKMNVVASLLDQSNWNSFVNTTYADSAIGTPTLEMFIASWNQKEYTKLNYNNSTENGYYIGIGEDTESTDSFYTMTDAEKEDILYALERKSSSGNMTDDAGGGYWLASPGDMSTDRVCYANDTIISTAGDPFSLDHGVRPVVCLKSDVNARKNEDGTWNLNKNTENNNTNSENDKKIVGEWSATGTNNNTEYSLMYLYGTSLSYANELTFNEDGTYKLAIGVAYYQEGNYEIDGNTIKLVNTEYKGDNPDSQLIEKLSIKDNQIILEETYDNEIVDVIFENKGNITNDENTNTSNANASNTNLTTTENTNQSTENNNSGELKIGNHTIKYGTYNGIDAATGDILIINSNQTATLNGENYTYTVGKHDFAQDSSGSSYQDAIIFKTASGETSFALYVGNDNNLYNDPMCYVYSGN